MDENIRARAATYTWFHSIDLGHGVVTSGAKPLSICSCEANAIFNRIDLIGRSVLDVGAWNGFFSFEAKRRGAAYVLATDSFCWSHPKFRGRETFDFARSVLGIDVDAREIDVAELSPDTVGKFDIVLYLGVFYHRYDAIEALARAARLAKHALVVETHLDLQHIDRPAMAFYPGSELAGDETNWWGPNVHCMKALLLGHGFSEVEFLAHPAYDNRGIFYAWRSLDARLNPLPEAEQTKSKTLNYRSKIIGEVCKPFRRLFK